MKEKILENKIVLITGSTSGLGSSILESCINEGAKIVIVSRRKEQLISIKNKYPKAILEYVVGDLAKEEILTKVSKLPFKYDAFVNSAGLIKLSPLGFITHQEISDLITINTISPISLCHKLFRMKRFNNNASILFISSINGVNIGHPAYSVYSASKAAISGFVKSLSLDVAKRGIRVNEIAPGFIRTNGTESLKGISLEDLEKDESKYPLRRHGKPTDIAEYATFLLSDKTTWVTGSTITIDGGLSIN